MAGGFALRCYAGISLHTSDGFNLETLYILDRKPRTLDAQEIKTLEDPPAIDMNDLELRHKNRLGSSALPPGGLSRVA